jgi:PAS domain S-box-containing protein
VLVSSEALELGGERYLLNNLLDITERKQAEEHLRESEARARAMLNAIPDLMFRLDRQGIFLDYKADVHDLHEQAVSLIGQRNQEVAPPEFANLIEREIETTLATGEIQTFEYQLSVPDSGLLDFEARMAPSGADEVIAIVRNISEQKRNQAIIYAQRDLARSIGRVSTLEEGLQLCLEVALQISGLDGGGIYLFEAGSSQLALVCHQGLGEAFVQAVTRFPAESPNAQAVLAGNSLYFSVDDPRIQNPLHQAEHLQAMVVVPVQHQGRAIGCLNLASHVLPYIPEHSRAGLETLAVEIGNFVIYLRSQLALRQSEKRFTTIFENTPLTIGISRLRDGVFIEINSAFTRLLGYTREEALGNTSQALDLWWDLADRQAVIAKLNQGQPVQGFETALRAKSGAKCEVLISGELIEINTEPCLMLQATDISARKQAEAEILERQRLLEAVLRLGRNVTAIPDLDQCLRQIYHSLRQGLGFDRVGVFLYEPAANQIRGTYGTSRTGEMVDNSWYARPVEEWTDWQLALQDPQGLVMVEDYQAVRHPAPENEMYGVKQHLTLAAWAGDKPAAMLVVDNLHSAKPITSVDQEALQLFAGYAGLAIANAQLHAGLEQRIRERTAEVQDLYDNAPTGYHSLDAQGCFVQINQTELGWLGYTRAEILGRPFADFVTPASWPVFQSNFPIFKQRGWVRDLEFELIRKDGSTFPVLISATAIQDEAGNYLMSRSTVFDNTERRKVEEALRASQASLQNFLDTASDLIQSLDEKGNYLYVNNAWCDTLGYPPAEALQLNLLQIVDPQHQALCQQTLQNLIRDQRPEEIEILFITKQGQPVMVEGRVTSRQDESGRIITSGIFRNVTERKRAQEALRESRDQLSAANAALEKAARMKDEFLASMSHELRTPLTGILGLSEALELKTYGDLNEKQLRALKNIELSGRHLLALINDILDLSKIEAGKLELQFEIVPLADICQASLQLTKGMAHQKNQKVSFSMSSTTDVVRADPRRLKQMLVNLLSNAIKFTPSGGSLGLSVEDAKSDQVIRLTVWDHGIGIQPEDLPRLFQPFVQLDSRLARQSEGTGLGLSLVQRMTELHGGSLQVESAPGAGSRFTIILPWSTQEVSPSPELSGQTGRLEQSLTVEDNRLDAEHLTRYLQTLGLKNLVSPVGATAVELAAASSPDVILLDLYLPDKSGLEVLAELKTDARTQSIPVIITSVAEKRAEALALGAAGYLVKPFSLAELHTELTRAVTDAKEPASVMVIAPVQTDPLILIVDDNEVTLQMFADVLETRNLRVATARSGMEMLKLAPEIHPDLILMDIQMPGMDGMEAIRRVRAHADPELATIPIIALTALAMTGDRERCLEAGANDYLSKPVQLQNLVAQIFELLAPRR